MYMRLHFFILPCSVWRDAAKNPINPERELNEGSTWRALRGHSDNSSLDDAGMSQHHFCTTMCASLLPAHPLKVHINTARARDTHEPSIALTEGIVGFPCISVGDLPGVVVA